VLQEDSSKVTKGLKRRVPKMVDLRPSLQRPNFPPSFPLFNAIPVHQTQTALLILP
jgi:hypothetical protein